MFDRKKRVPMDTVEKLRILADAAKYDVACTSSGIDRDAAPGMLGNAAAAGICHSFSADGRCITLLKVLFTNACVYDCAYCANRRENDIARVAFKPRELADLTIGFYRRNYIEGLFLSSGVLGTADYTMELVVETLRILREEYGFRGYIHAKAVPGASPDLVARTGRLADRVSVNLELPSRESLALLCPDKTKESIMEPMRLIKDGIAEDRDTRSIVRKGRCYMAERRPRTPARAFAPAGQSTQMIVGATPETDRRILALSSSLYKTMGLKRVFFSAYLPVNADGRLPASDAVQLDREHRLYQADWLMRFYRFDVDEIIGEGEAFLERDLDPKAAWALRHLDLFPVEVNTARYEVLVRVPGIGVRGARAIVAARRATSLGEAELRKLGVAYRRARYFITCRGKYQGAGVPYDPEALRARLRAPIRAGAHGRRADRALEGQLSLWEEASAPRRFEAPAASSASAMRAEGTCA